ncbi:MAG: hypothetical protein ABW168_07030, partial [Sedimenticola sp.]
QSKQINKSETHGATVEFDSVNPNEDKQHQMSKVTGDAHNRDKLIENDKSNDTHIETDTLVRNKIRGKRKTKFPGVNDTFNNPTNVPSVKMKPIQFYRQTKTDRLKRMTNDSNASNAEYKRKPPSLRGTNWIPFRV